MDNLETNEFEVADGAGVSKATKRKAFGTVEPEYTWIENEIMGRRTQMNFPAMQAMFGLTETELQTILDKLPPVEDCNC